MSVLSLRRSFELVVLSVRCLSKVRTLDFLMVLCRLSFIFWSFLVLTSILSVFFCNGRYAVFLDDFFDLEAHFNRRWFMGWAGFRWIDDVALFWWWELVFIREFDVGDRMEEVFVCSIWVDGGEVILKCRLGASLRRFSKIDGGFVSEKGEARSEWAISVDGGTLFDWMGVSRRFFVNVAGVL